MYLGGEEHPSESIQPRRMDTLLYHMHTHIRLATKVNCVLPTISTIFVLPNARAQHLFAWALEDLARLFSHLFHRTFDSFPPYGCWDHHYVGHRRNISQYGGAAVDVFVSKGDETMGVRFWSQTSSLWESSTKALKFFQCFQLSYTESGVGLLKIGL